MKRLVILSLGLVLASGLFAAGEWTEYKTQGSVKILYQYTDCHDTKNGIHQQKVVFRFENKGTKKVTVSFEKQTTYNSASDAKPDIKTYSLVLGPGQSIEGKCETSNKALYIFSKHLDMKGTELQKFDLKNISVKTIE